MKIDSGFLFLIFQSLPKRRHLIHLFIIELAEKVFSHTSTVDFFCADVRQVGKMAYSYIGHCSGLNLYPLHSDQTTISTASGRMI